MVVYSIQSGYKINFEYVGIGPCGPDGVIYVVLNEPDKILRLTPMID